MSNQLRGSNGPAAHDTDHDYYMLSYEMFLCYLVYSRYSRIHLGIATEADITPPLEYVYSANVFPGNVFPGNEFVLQQQYSTLSNADDHDDQEIFNSSPSSSPSLSFRHSRQSTPDSGYSSPTPPTPPPLSSPGRRQPRRKASGAALLRRDDTGTEIPVRYGCSLCNRTYSRVQDANRHLRSHSDERNEHCSYCPKTFKRRDISMRHERSCRRNPFNQNR